MQTIERLNYSQPPPGYRVDYYQPHPSRRQEWGWTLDVVDGLDQHSEDIVDGASEAIAAAWAHYKERHDPPGLAVVPSENERHPHFYVDHHSAVSIPNHATAERARTAAWAWYDARLALALEMDVDGGTNFWPRVLTWSNEQVAEVERWLVFSTAEMPEVLRG